MNADGLTRTRGGEFLARYRWDELRLSVSYVHVSAAEPDPDQPGRRTVPLTPRDAAGMTLSWEEPGRGRIGLEGFYVGRQSLADNPFRQTSRPYVQIGAMAQVNIGRVSLFAGFSKGETAVLDVNAIHYNELVVTGAFGLSRLDYQDVLHMVDDGRIGLGHMVTHRFALAEVAAAFQMAEGGGAMKVAIVDA